MGCFGPKASEKDERSSSSSKPKKETKTTNGDKKLEKAESKRLKAERRESLKNERESLRIERQKSKGRKKEGGSEDDAVQVLKKEEDRVEISERKVESIRNKTEELPELQGYDPSWDKEVTGRSNAAGVADAAEPHEEEGDNSVLLNEIDRRLGHAPSMRLSEANAKRVVDIASKDFDDIDDEPSGRGLASDGVKQIRGGMDGGGGGRSPPSPLEADAQLMGGHTLKGYSASTHGSLRRDEHMQRNNDVDEFGESKLKTRSAMGVSSEPQWLREHGHHASNGGEDDVDILDSSEWEGNNNFVPSSAEKHDVLKLDGGSEPSSPCFERDRASSLAVNTDVDVGEMQSLSDFGLGDPRYSMIENDAATVSEGRPLLSGVEATVAATGDGDGKENDPWRDLQSAYKIHRGDIDDEEENRLENMYVAESKPDPRVYASKFDDDDLGIDLSVDTVKRDIANPKQKPVMNGW